MQFLSLSHASCDSHERNLPEERTGEQCVKEVWNRDPLQVIQVQQIP